MITTANEQREIALGTNWPVKAYLDKTATCRKVKRLEEHGGRGGD